MKRKLAIIGILTMAPLASFATLPSPQATLADHAAIRYVASTPSDPIVAVQRRLDSKEARLDYETDWGYLRSLLRELRIPVSSQTLVFSKTSLQTDRISPKTPRALYFNDDIYVGAVKDGPFIEIASMDPQLGPVFYSLIQDAQRAPKFKRELYDCMVCHESAANTRGVPGLLMLSVLTDVRGFPLRDTGTMATTPQTPFTDRWGGWYVTGTYGNQVHRGNRIADGQPEAIGTNLTSLREFFPINEYPAGDSDVVALLVLAHQVQVHNAITSANYEVRMALHEQPAPVSETTKRRVESAMESLLKTMLLEGQSPLPNEVRGTTNFAGDFQALEPRDPLGRSLRELDLKRKLFRYPLSFLVYSQGFGAIPEIARTHFYKRLAEVLGGKDTSGEFAQLSAADRQATLEILRNTKREFAVQLEE